MTASFQRRRLLPQATRASCDEMLPELSRRCRVTVGKKLCAPLRLVALSDGIGRSGERVQASQEAAVGLVRPRHRAVALPAVAAESVEAAVIAHARIGVGLDDLV